MIWMTAALAQSLNPFAGTWTLDAEASGDLDTIMKAQGIAWPLRKLAASARPQLMVAVHDDELHITTTDTLGGREDLLRPDGVWRATPSRQGDVPCATTWRGPALRTQCRLESGGLLVTRQIEAGVWTQQITFTPKGQVPVTATRVFRR